MLNYYELPSSAPAYAKAKLAGIIIRFVDEREDCASPLIAIAGRVDPPGCSKTEALDLLGPMVVYPDLLGGVCFRSLTFRADPNSAHLERHQGPLLH